MFFYLFLYISGFLLSIFTLLMLIFYDWRSLNLSLRKKYLKLPHPEMNFITGIGFEAAKLPKDALLDYMMKLWKSTGNVFYFHILGYPNVILTNPEDIEILLNNTKYLRKGDEYDMLRPWLGNGLLTSTGDHWHTRRKQLTPSFHFKILENYLPIFNRNANILVEKLAETRGESIEISPVVSSCTLNIICETAMDTSLNLLAKDAREYADAVKEVSDITVVRITTFWLFKDWIFYFTPIGRRYRKLMRQIHNFIDNVIAERRQTIDAEQKYMLTGNDERWIILGNEDGLYKQRKSFLDHLLLIQKENPAILSNKDIHEEVNTFMFEGHDTIAAAITWTLFMLANYPEIQDKVREELNEVFPYCDDREATIDDLNKLQYLEMVLKETLRLYPSVPYFTRRIPFDLHIVTGGHVIPAETNVGVMTHLVHRNPDVFEDPETFDPQRFSPKKSKAYHPYAYLPFSAGYRNCIGQRFAMMEGKTVLSTILKKYRVSSTQKRENIKINPAVVSRASPKIILSFTAISASNAKLQ